jgi:Ni/Co efflux regulator RcnB
MTRRFRNGLISAMTLALLGVVVVAGVPAMAQQEQHPQGHPAARAAAAARPAEPHPGPKGYQRIAEPQGWNVRPKTVDPGAYQHNYQAARSFRIGPYRAPSGWVARRWTYGQMLPRQYWAAQYILADYWLFGLEVPPVGYEWVRYGTDALLINTASGQILQVEYGVFA